MLSKKFRLNKKKDFDRVFQTGLSAYNQILGIKVLQNNEQENSRFGIMVSNKVDKKAVVRNQIKRRLRAALFSQLDYFKQPCDLVVIAQTKIKEADYQEILKTISSLLKKLKLLNEIDKK